MLLGPIGSRISALLEDVNDQAGFSLSLVCDASGLLIAVAGEGVDEEQLAGLTSLFDDIVIRARRDVGLSVVDEVTMLDPQWGRCIIRPLDTSYSARLFLVVRVPSRSTWRRYTNQLKRDIAELFLTEADS